MDDILDADSSSGFVSSSFQENDDVLPEKNDSFDNTTEDEGIEIFEISDTSQTTPEAISVNPALCDSGFTETLNLQCLECVLEWPSKHRHQHGSGGVHCTCSSDEHTGFEDYVDDIYLHRLSIEEKYHAPACLDNQPEITVGMRAVIIQWLTVVHHDFKLCQDTLYLTVNIVDRVLDVMQVSRDCLELLGITCLLVASKKNEVCPPEILELLGKCRDVFTREQVWQLELIVLMATGFDLLAPTVQQFLEYFASYGIAASAGDDEHIYKLKMARAVGRCLLEISLHEYEFCQFRPSLLALCVWKASIEYLKTFDGNFIPPGLNYTKQQYDFCLAAVNLFIDNFQQTCPDMTSLYEKYANLYGSK